MLARAVVRALLLLLLLTLLLQLPLLLVPLTLLLLKGLPSVPSLNEVPQAYALVMFTMGLTCTWAGAGCNSPIFAEIVPDELRSTIYAFDR